MRPNPLQRRSSVPVTRRQHSRRLLLELLETRVVPTNFFANLSGLTFSNGAFFTGPVARLTGAPQGPGGGSVGFPGSGFHATEQTTATTTTVVSSVNPSGFGQTVTFTATVTARTPGGSG